MSHVRECNRQSVCVCAWVLVCVGVRVCVCVIEEVGGKIWK